MGTLVSCNGTAVLLEAPELHIKDPKERAAAMARNPDKKGWPRRLWRWRGANTLHEVSLYGIEPGSRISEPIEQILLTQAIEVLVPTEKARETLEVSAWPD
jgi:hypothetical protein